MRGEGFDYTNDQERRADRAERALALTVAKLNDVRTIAAGLLAGQVIREHEIGDQLMRIVYRQDGSA